MVDLATPQQEALFEAKAEKYFKSQRELIPGRNFLWNHMPEKDSLKKYRDNYDKIFSQTE